MRKTRVSTQEYGRVGLNEENKGEEHKSVEGESWMKGTRVRSTRVWKVRAG